MVGQSAKFLIQLISTAIVARILTPTDYGLVAMVTALLAIVTLLKDLGLSQATVQREEITHEQMSGLFWLNVAMGSALMLLIATAAPFVAWFYGHTELLWITLAYAAMAPVGSIGAQHHAVLQRELRFLTLALRDTAAALSGAIAGIMAAANGWGYWSLVLMQAVSQLVGTLALFCRASWRPSRPRLSNQIKPLVRFGGTLTLSNLIGFLVSGLDSVVLGYFAGPTGLGLYNRAQGALARPIQQFLPPLMSVASSVFARSAHDPVRFQRAACQLLFLIATVSGLVAVLFFVCGDCIVHLMLGRQWSEAVPIVRMLALFAVVEPVASFLGMLLIARGLPDKLVRWRILSAGVVVAGIFAGLPWGPLGVATTYSISGLLIRTPIFAWYAGRSVGIAPPQIFRVTFAPLLTAIVAAAILTALRHTIGHPASPVLSLALYGILCGILFIAALWAVPYSRRMLAESIQLGKAGFAPAIES